VNVVVIFSDLLIQGLPWFLRRAVFSAFFRAVGTVMQPINDTYAGTAGAIRERLRFTGQIVSLEYRLNDVFDATLRRIFIEDTAFLIGVFLHTKSEAFPFPVYLFRKSEAAAPLYIYRKSEVAGGVGFVVHVPDDLGSAITEARIRKEVDRYRAAGTSYTVIFEPL